MRFFDRFTRDDVSAKVWWPFTMLLLVLLVLTFPGEHRAIDARHRVTAEIDAGLSARVIQPNLASASAATITGTLSQQLTEEVHDEILVNDPRIRAVRLWSTSHELVWSSIPGERLGVDTALNDDAIDAALEAAGGPTSVTTDRTPGNAPSPTLFYAYAAVGPQPLVAEYEYLDSQLTSDVRATWLGYQIVFALGFLLSLTFSLLSMREPKARIGTGVPFYAESVPPYLAVIDADRAVAIEQAGDRIRERVGGLQQKLDESEAARLKAEGQLQQALAALNTPGHRMPVPMPDVVPPPVIPPPQPPVEVAPPEPVPVPVPEPVAHAPEPAPEPKRPRAKPKAEPMPEPMVVAPEPEPVVVAALQPEPEPESAVAASTDRPGWPEVVIVPELQPVKSAPAPGEESAADLLDRLVEPVGAHDPSEDAGNLRARLARTAAIKKPGSKERREADEQQHRH